jgi:hypothetical protein
MRRLLLTGAVALAVLALAACGDSDADSPTPTPTPPAGFTPAIDEGSPEPSPKVEPVPERTGVEELDPIIEAFILQDMKSLLPQLRYQTLGCGLTPGVGGSPPCRPDQDLGALVDAMPVSACEFGYYLPHEFEAFFAPFLQQEVYGVYEATPQVRFPGDYVIVLTRPRPDDPSLQIAMELTVKDGRVVGVHSGCPATPEELVAEHRLGEPLWAPEG